MLNRLSFVMVICLVAGAAPAQPAADLVLRGGTIYDGGGGAPYVGDVAIRDDRIIAVGDIEDIRGRREIDVSDLAVAPGFINMLSWATVSLIEDGRSMADIKQGVTLELFGEGSSMGPMNDMLKAYTLERQGDIKFDIEWTTLAEYLEYLERRGVSCNVASLVGATTVRIHELGFEDRPPTPRELRRMQQLVREAMEDGAMGVGSSLIYAPAFYADTDELIALCEVAAEYNGLFTSHIRSEGDRLLEGVDEIIEIARATDVRAEIYHLKAAGKSNWHKMDQVIDTVEHAKRDGVRISADMYNYVAGATGLDASMPPWVQEGGFPAWKKRLQDPEIRAQVIHEMTQPGDGWENLYHAAGSADNLLLVGFKNDDLKPLTGMTLAEVATMRGTPPEETALDLVIEDDSRVGTVYFLMSEENVRKQIALPWVTFCSDAGSPATEGVFLKSNPHPRAYGNFSRLLGKYVRDEEIITLQEAVKRLTTLSAAKLRITDRGALAAGFFADVVVFDPEWIQDHATFQDPHQYATGMVHVFVNGEQVLRDGEHTGATPGRVVRGPGWTGRR